LLDYQHYNPKHKLFFTIQSINIVCFQAKQSLLTYKAIIRIRTLSCFIPTKNHFKNKELALKHFKLV